MRTTLNIDDELFQQARDLSGLQKKMAVIREGLKALIYVVQTSARQVQKCMLMSVHIGSDFLKHLGQRNS